MADIWDHRPDLVVVSGDLTQRARRDQFTRARAFLDRLPAPVLTVMGNHDVPLFDLPRRLVSPTGRYQTYVTPSLDPVFDLPDLVAVGLDSMPAWRWKAGHVSSRQADLARDTLGRSPKGAWRVLVTHHPVLPANLSALRGRQHLVDACDQAGVALFLSGHTHTARVDVVSYRRRRAASCARRGRRDGHQFADSRNGEYLQRGEPYEAHGGRCDRDRGDPPSEAFGLGGRSNGGVRLLRRWHRRSSPAVK